MRHPHICRCIRPPFSLTHVPLLSSSPAGGTCMRRPSVVKMELCVMRALSAWTQPTRMAGLAKALLLSGFQPNRRTQGYLHAARSYTRRACRVAALHLLFARICIIFVITSYCTTPSTTQATQFGSVRSRAAAARRSTGTGTGGGSGGIKAN
jgi:hypothetical protein